MSVKSESVRLFSEIIADDKDEMIAVCCSFMHIQNIHGYPVKSGNVFMGIRDGGALPLWDEHSGHLAHQHVTSRSILG